MAIYRYVLNKNKVYAAIVALELIAVYVLLNLSFSLILQSAKMTADESNSDALTLFGYISVAAVALYAFTVAIKNVVGYTREARFYQICVALGATKKQLEVAKSAYTLTVYGVAFVLGAVVCTALDAKEASAGIGVRFFTYAGQGVALAVYALLTALDLALGIYLVRKSDALKDLLGGSDNV